MATLESRRERELWASFRCPKCDGTRVRPYKATTCLGVSSVRVGLRCPDCEHSWELIHDEGTEPQPAAAPLPPDRSSRH